MRYGLRAGLSPLPRRALWPVVCAGAFIVAGCSAATTCDLSPVEIEELREDIGVQEKDLATVREREAALAKELATKQADVDAIRDKPDELRRKLEQVKKGSGRVEKPKPVEPPRTPVEQKTGQGEVKKESP